MLHRLAQERMTLSDLGWPFHASCTISAMVELVIILLVVVIFINA